MRKKVLAYSIPAIFFLAASYTVSQAIEITRLLDCKYVESIDSGSIEFVNFWSNHEVAEGGEHEYGYNVMLFQVGGVYGGWIENLFGPVGDGGNLYAMRDINYIPGKRLKFSALLNSEAESPWPFTLDLSGNKATLTVDQYTQETLEILKSNWDPNWIFKRYLTKALGCGNAN